MIADAPDRGAVAAVTTVAVRHRGAGRPRGAGRLQGAGRRPGAVMIVVAPRPDVRQTADALDRAVTIEGAMTAATIAGTTAGTIAVETTAGTTAAATIAGTTAVAVMTEGMTGPPPLQPQRTLRRRVSTSMRSRRRRLASRWSATVMRNETPVQRG